MDDFRRDATEENASPVKPFWAPPGVALEDLPAELRDAATSIVGPTYELLVLGGRPGLAQSAGVTLVGLLWLEILGYYELGQESLHHQVDKENFDRREKSIARLLRVVNAKSQASSFLWRLREARRRWAEESAALGMHSATQEGV